MARRNLQGALLVLDWLGEPRAGAPGTLPSAIDVNGLKVEIDGESLTHFVALALAESLEHALGADVLAQLSVAGARLSIGPDGWRYSKGGGARGGQHEPATLAKGEQWP